MSIVQSLAFDEICNRKSIKTADVDRLRALVTTMPLISDSDVKALLAINQACPVQASEWQPFLVSTIAEFLVDDMEPRGYVSQANAGWLLAELERNGLIRTRNGTAIVLATLDHARWAPQALVRHILGRLADQMSASTSPKTPDFVVACSALSAFASQEALPLTPAELRQLFRIDAAADVCPPGWRVLMMRAVSNAALAASGYNVPPRHRALGPSDELTLLSDDMTLSELIDFALSPICEDYTMQNREDRLIANLECQRIEIITGEPVVTMSANDLAVLLRRVGGDSLHVLAFLLAHGFRLGGHLAGLSANADAA